MICHFNFYFYDPSSNPLSHNNLVVFFLHWEPLQVQKSIPRRAGWLITWCTGETEPCQRKLSSPTLWSSYSMCVSLRSFLSKMKAERIVAVAQMVVQSSRYHPGVTQWTKGWCPSHPTPHPPACGLHGKVSLSKVFKILMSQCCACMVAASDQQALCKVIRATIVWMGECWLAGLKLTDWSNWQEKYCLTASHLTSCCSLTVVSFSPSPFSFFLTPFPFPCSCCPSLLVHYPLTNGAADELGIEFMGKITSCWVSLIAALNLSCPLSSAKQHIQKACNPAQQGHPPLKKLMRHQSPWKHCGGELDVFCLHKEQYC